MQKTTCGIIPYSQQWNQTLEPQFGDKVLILAAYVGNKVTHMYLFVTALSNETFALFHNTGKGAFADVTLAFRDRQSEPPLDRLVERDGGLQ